MPAKTKTKTKTKAYKADFYCLTVDAYRTHSVIFDWLSAASANGDYTEAIALEKDSDEKFQIRSLMSLKNDGVIRGVFGRCRFDEKPVQGTADGKETDVVLKPGHGLVEKNFFLFFPNRNLIVYQRNSTGSHYAKLQHYLNVALSRNVMAEPVLSRDSYERLLNGGGAKSAEFSFAKPADASLYKDQSAQDAIQLLSNSNAVTGKVRLSMGRTEQNLGTNFISAIVNMARRGLAKVAKVQLHAESEAIDLIADRVTYTMSVNIISGRPVPGEVWSQLAAAESSKRSELKVFFGK